MNKATVTIVGMGPRGLSILERIAELAHTRPQSMPIEIHLIDPGECGQGTHYARQPHHLITNTIASQVTMFPPQSVVGGADGTSLAQWARLSGYRRVGSSFYPAGPDCGEEITDQDYLPRRLLGEYLTWVYDRVAQSLPRNIRLRHHRQLAVDVAKNEDGGYGVRLENGFVIESDFVFLTTGHCKRRPGKDDKIFMDFVEQYSKVNGKLCYFPHAYPVEQLSRISPDATVAVQGLGLTAHDIISELTVGRGGRFVPDGDGLRYEKSGREPHILLYSRSCIPFSVRGVNQKGVSGRYTPNFFTPEAIQSLRERAMATRGSDQLEFDKELIPLLMLDMGYVYRVAKEGKPISPDGFQLRDDERAAIEEILDPLRGKRFKDLASFKQFFRDYVIADLEEANKGNVDSPVKAITDVLRDVRESLRLSSEYGGLTPASHPIFVSDFVNLINRVTFGPPRHRNVELLTLWDAGVIDVAGGPEARTSVDPESAKFVIENRFPSGPARQTADALVMARIDVFSPVTDNSPLIRSLLRRGIVRPYLNGTYHPGGIDIDRANHPINAHGECEENLWAIGYLVEGPHFYTQELPRTLRYSRTTHDAEKCVVEMFDLISARSMSKSPARSKIDREAADLSVPSGA